MAVELSAGKEADPETEWLGIVCFGRLAETLLGHEKGSLLSVSGRVQINSYTKDGIVRRQLQIVADTIDSAAIRARANDPIRARRRSPLTGEVARSLSAERPKGPLGDGWRASPHARAP